MQIPIFDKVKVFVQNLGLLPMALFFAQTSKSTPRVIDDFQFLNDEDLELNSGTLLKWELERYYLACDVLKHRAFVISLKDNLNHINKTLSEIQGFERAYTRLLHDTPYHQASISIKTKEDYEAAQLLKDESYDVAKDNLKAIGAARNMLTGWKGAIEYILNLVEPNEPKPSSDTLTPTASNAPETPHTNAEKQKYVRSILAPLAGLSPQKQPIMSKDKFDRLITYVDHLVLTKTLPQNIESISQTGISNQHIRYTFYRLHKELFGTQRIQDTFIEFLHIMFTQFNGTAEKTTKSKFATPPKSYKKDFAGFIGEVP